MPLFPIKPWKLRKTGISCKKINFNSLFLVREHWSLYLIIRSAIITVGPVILNCGHASNEGIFISGGARVNSNIYKIGHP